MAEIISTIVVVFICFVLIAGICQQTRLRTNFHKEIPMNVKRNKTRPLTIYIDPKYNDKLEYLKLSSSITRYIEKCLDNLQVDQNVFDMLRKLKTEELDMLRKLKEP